MPNTHTKQALTREEIAAMFLSAAQTYHHSGARANDRKRAMVMMQLTRVLAVRNGFTDRDIIPLLKVVE